MKKTKSYIAYEAPRVESANMVSYPCFCSSEYDGDYNEAYETGEDVLIF